MDEDLIKRAQEGNQSAFRALMETYARVAWRTAWVLLGDRMLAEDATQDAWLNVWRSLPTFQRGRSFRPWLLTIVANRCRTLSRRVVPVISLDADDPQHVIVAAVDDVAALYVRQETDAEVRAALAQLPLDQRAVVDLRYFAGLDLAEIAAVLQVPLGTVKSRLHRAHGALRLRLQHTCTEEVPHE